MSKEEVIKRMYMEGKPVHDIRRSTKAGLTTISMVCEGLTTNNRPKRGPKPKWTPERVRMIRNLARIFTLNEIGQALGISRQRVSRIIKKG